MFPDDERGVNGKDPKVFIPYKDDVYKYIQDHNIYNRIKDLEEQLDRSATSIRAQVFYLRKRGWTFTRKKDE